VVASVAVVLVAGACHRPPQIAFARLLEQAASWAASAEFADAMRTWGRVPQAYVHGLLQHGTEEVTALQAELSSFDDISPSMRLKALTLCGRLAATLQSSAQGGRQANVDDLRGIEAQLRDLASSSRSGATGASSGGAR